MPGLPTWLCVSVVAASLVVTRTSTAESSGETSVGSDGDDMGDAAEATGETDTSMPATSNPRPYSPPWQMRPIVAQTSVRSDSVLARYVDKDGASGTTTVSSLGAAFKVGDTGRPGQGLALSARLTMVNDSPPVGPGGLILVNPVIGAAVALRPAPILRMGFSLGLNLPFGGGGGDNPDAGSLNSRTKGAIARASMDNGTFAVNDVGLSPGFDIAIVSHGLTVQLEATVIHAIRARAKATQLETSKTNFTSGVHVGYFLIPELSLGVEMRYQRYINPPLAIERDATRATLDNLTIAAGPRVHIKLGEHWFRPGIAYARGLDRPMAASPPSYHILQLDLPFIF